MFTTDVVFLGYYRVYYYVQVLEETGGACDVFTKTFGLLIIFKNWFNCGEHYINLKELGEQTLLIFSIFKKFDYDWKDGWIIMVVIVLLIAYSHLYLP